MPTTESVPDAQSSGVSADAPGQIPKFSLLDFIEASEALARTRLHIQACERIDGHGEDFTDTFTVCLLCARASVAGDEIVHNPTCVVGAVLALAAFQREELAAKMLRSALDGHTWIKCNDPSSPGWCRVCNCYPWDCVFAIGEERRVVCGAVWAEGDRTLTCDLEIGHAQSWHWNEAQRFSWPGASLAAKFTGTASELAAEFRATYAQPEGSSIPDPADSGLTIFEVAR